MIPAFNTSHVLPPFTGADSTEGDSVSPYKATMLEFVVRFSTSVERREILKGLIAYRSEIRRLGFIEGYQWLDGSFCCDIEIIESRPPGDIDIVTYVKRPAKAKANDEILILMNDNLDLFSPIRSKLVYKVDAYVVDMDIDPLYIVERASYWHGVFGHQRVTSLWKGMVRIDLDSDDLEGLSYLEKLDDADAAAAAAVA